MENEDKLKHASSRKVFLKDNKVVKFYPHIYGYLFHDLVFMGFSLFFFHIMVPISIKNKIRNEIEGRKTLKKMGIKTTKLRFFSEKSLGEEFEAGASTIDDLELSNPRKAFHVVKKIGKITRKLHNKNLYFIDNRSSNWIFNKDIKRTDLELFRSCSKPKEFFIFCDILSFISSVKNEKTKEKFLEGYGIKFNISRFLQFLVAVYIKLTDLIF